MRGVFPGSTRFLRGWLAATAVVAVSVAVTSGISAPTADAATPQAVGVAPQVPHGAVRTGTPDGNTQLRLDVELAPRNEAGLAAFVQSVSDPKSANYKHYLAKGQFASTFGPSQATVASVTSALRAEGLTTGAPTPDGLTIPVTTTFAKAGSVFGTSFTNYRLTDGRNAFANDKAPSLPSSVASQVQGIVGLNSLVTQKAHYTNGSPHALPKAVSNSATAHAKPNSASPHTASPIMCSGLQNALASGGAFDGEQYWEPGTLSPSTGYNTATLANNYGNTGQNVTVALYEQELYDDTDLVDYQQCWGLNVPVYPITVDGGPTATPEPTIQNGLVTPGPGFESAMDIDAISGMAPGATILVYQAPDKAFDSQALDTYQRMETDDAAQVLSTSWGACEVAVAQSDMAYIQSLNNIFAAAAAQGQTTVAAAGDSGSTDCYNDPNLNGEFATNLNVDVPADSPYVTAAGGTTLAGGSPTDVASTWHNPGEGSGGGVSAIFTTSYQTTQGAGYSNACSAASGTTCRQVPDVAALANEQTGYEIYYGQDPTSGDEFFWQSGGTSLAAPLWAVMAALADASLPCAATGNVGLMNPALYANPGAMNDVTTGNNDVTESGYTGGLYVAGTGYDMTTGLGTPNGAKLVEALCDSKTTTSGSSYVPVSPVRIMDTGTPGVGPGGVQKLQIDGSDSGAVPTSGVTAVVLNVTAVNPTQASYLTIYPDGTPRPASSNLDFAANQVIPNLVTVQVGSDGAIDFFNHTGNVQVLADLQGYYTTNTSGVSTYEPVAPNRIMNETSDGPGGHIVLPILGQGGVPSSGVTGVILNVTETNPTNPSYLSVYPDQTTQPIVSNLNFFPGDTIANMVIVPVGSDGAINIFNHIGTVTVLADVEGYYTGGESGLKLHATAPHRILDTRNNDGVPGTGAPAPIGGGGTFNLPVGDVSGVGNLGPIGQAGGIVLNVIATDTSNPSYLKVYPSGAGSPFVSNIDFAAGQTIPNGVISQLNGPYLTFYNHIGTVDVVADLFGYFASN